jgi:PKD repeat protein
MDQNSIVRRCTLLALAFVILGARSASADTLTLMWDFNTEPEVTGYVVHVGTQPGVYSQSVNVGNTDRYVFSSAVAGQQYCFVVFAYAGDLMSPPSAEVCGSSGTPPFLDQPSDQTSTVGQSVTLQLNGGHSSGATVTYTASGLPPGLMITQSLGLISGVPTTAGNYSVTATATANGLSVSRSFSWTIEAANRAPSLVNPGAQTSTVGQSVTLHLQGSDPDGQALTYTATGLPAGLSISSAGHISGAPTTAGTYNVTATVSDGALSASQTFGWTVHQPNRAPVLTNPGNQATDINTAVTLQLQASDADGDTLSFVASGLPTGLQLSQSTGAITGTPTQAASFSVSVTVSDGALSASQAFTWTIRTLNAAPTLASPGNQTTTAGTFVVLDLQGADANGDPLTYSATGLPAGLQLGANTGRIAGTPTTAGTYAVSATVSDGSLSASASFTWTVNAANVAPVLTAPADRTSDMNVATSLQLQATDANGDALTYAAVGLPPGLSINTSTGLIAGTPTLAGVFAVDVSASDGAAVVTASFTWTIQDTSSGSSVSLANPGTQRHNVGQQVSLQLQSNSTGVLTFSASNLPPGLSLNATTGLITGAPTTPGTYTVSVSVSNGTSTATRGFTWIIRGTNTAPVLTNPGPQTHNVGDAVVLQLLASDANGDTLTYAATGLPAGLQIDAATGRITGFPTTAGTFSVTASVSDGTATATQAFSWTIAVANTAPTLAAPGNQTSTAGQAASLQLQGADADGDTLTYWATGLPPGLQLNAGTGQISGTPSTAGTYAVSATVSDGSLSASRQFTWTVLAANAAPTLAAVANQTSTVGQAASLQLQGADSNGDALAYTAAGLPPGLQLNPGTGSITGTPTTAGIYGVTATVTDGALSASRSFTWTVVTPNVAPTLAAPGDQSGTVGQPASLQLQGADANGDALTYTATGLPAGLQINAATGQIAGTPTTAGTFGVTATVSDGSLSASRSFTWTIAVANTAPTLSTLSAQSTVEGEAALIDVQASDPNGDALTYTATGLPPGLQIESTTGRISGTPTAPGAYTVTVVVSDGQLNAQRSFAWTVVARAVSTGTAVTRTTSNSTYTGTSAALREKPVTTPEPARKYSGAGAAERPGGAITAPVDAPQYTGTAALTRPGTTPGPSSSTTQTGTTVVSDSSSFEVKSSTLQEATAVTRSVATTQTVSGSAAGTETVTVTDTGMTSTAPSGSAVSAPRGAPSVSIDTPVDYARFAEGATVIFSGRAFDAEDGTLSHAIVWTSSLDGRLGTGASITQVLSTGTHIISAQVIDGDGNSRRAQVTVGVE